MYWVYPSVIRWLEPKHPAGNQTAGSSLKDGAKCGNGVDKTECNQTAGMELRLGLEYRKNCPPGKVNNLDVKFNHNLTSTKSSRIKGGKSKAKLTTIYSSKGSKRKATELTDQCQTDNSKRRKYGPMDRHINNSAKLGCNNSEGQFRWKFQYQLYPEINGLDPYLRRSGTHVC